MKHIYIVFLMTVCLLASANNFAYPNGTTIENGQLIIAKNKGESIPFSSELLGNNHYLPDSSYAIENYVNGQKDGLSVCFSEKTIFYTAHYKNGVLHGNLTLYPNAIYSVSATVKNGVLDGECIAIFQPYKYSEKSKATSVGNYNIKKIGIPESMWIYNANSAFCIQTSGLYAKGKRSKGDFLSIIPEMDVRIVEVYKYEDFKLIEKTLPRVFKLKPFAYNISEPVE